MQECGVMSGTRTVKKRRKLTNAQYAEELLKLQVQLTDMLDWVIQQRKKIVVIFEGRDAAGKGSCIKRITEYLRPRYCRVVALPSPTEEERMQWYFQRYVEHLPTGGELVIFDRSWYNRAGVEHVMGFCTQEEYEEFLQTVPLFESMLVRSGIQLLKYWFSVSDEVQEKRFRNRVNEPHKSWKLSDMDIQSRLRWVDYSRAKDVMFERTSTKDAPWYVVDGDIKPLARLNCIHHLLSMVDYRKIDKKLPTLTKRPLDDTYNRPPFETQNLIPKIYK